MPGGSQRAGADGAGRAGGGRAGANGESLKMGA